MKNTRALIGSDMEFLSFLRSKFPMYHQSNFFFRDIQYGVADLLRNKGVHVRSDQAEKIAREYVANLEKAKLLVPINRQTWAVNHPDFRTPQVKPDPKPAPKPATAAATA